MSLTPREHAAKIRKILDAERKMRERVFRNNPPVQRTKVGEIDEALKHLEALERAAVQREAPQGDLFGPAEP